jgi:hypothetical protein
MNKNYFTKEFTKATEKSSTKKENKNNNNSNNKKENIMRFRTSFQGWKFHCSFIFKYSLNLQM